MNCGIWHTQEIELRTCVWTSILSVVHGPSKRSANNIIENVLQDGQTSDRRTDSGVYRVAPQLKIKEENVMKSCNRTDPFKVFYMASLSEFVLGACYYFQNDKAGLQATSNQFLQKVHKLNKGKNWWRFHSWIFFFNSVFFVFFVCLSVCPTFLNDDWPFL